LRMIEPSTGDVEPTPGQPVLEYASPAPAAGAEAALGFGTRVAGVIAGVLLPLACFAFSFTGEGIEVRWQSGRWSDYARLLLHGPVTWPFFPLLGWSMVAMLVACVEPAHYARRRWVRAGVYAGVVLAAGYCAVYMLAMSGGNAAGMVRPVGMGTLAAVVWAGGIYAVNEWYPTLPGRSIVPVVVVLTVLAVLIFPVAVVMLIVAPPLTLTTYGLAAFRLWRWASVSAAGSEVGGRGLVAGAAWLGGYAAAWGVAVRQAINVYQTLPVTPPGNCYVASSATGGHAWFVGSTGVVIEGVPVAVNDQLRRLKAVEIALAVGWPAAHRAVRRVYDQVGPVMARVIRRNRWLADAAYVSLKPLEWVGVWIVRRGLADFDELAAGIYPAATDAGIDSASPRGR
jgi:hypothetical protein